MSRRRIGICTGGGDCPGLNAAIRGVVLQAERLGMEVIGVEDGFDGLMAGTGAGTRVLTSEEVRPLLDLGGTVLGTTNRGNPLAYPGPDGPRDRGDEVVARARTLGLECLITAGGDGTQTIALGLAARGLPVIGLPKTIDNDLAHTYRTFGHATAVQVVTDALDRLRTTAESHERVMVLEVMGRSAGWIALSAGIAGGAHAILLPELPYDPAAVGARLRARFSRTRRFALVVVAEGAHPPGEPPAHRRTPGAQSREVLGGAGARAAELLAPHLPGVELRVTVLGHLQRGGTPVAPDRLLATRLGVEAARAAHRREHGTLACWDPPNVRMIPLDESIRRPRRVDPAGQLVAHARALGVAFGHPGDDPPA